MGKKVAVIGSGGREHSILWELAQSPQIEKLYAIPGNAGTLSIAENVDIQPTDIDGLADFVVNNNIDLTVVCLDDILELGIVDIFQSRGLRIFGPTRGAARIEYSKVFAKKFMVKHGIPTADFQVFQEYGKALKYIEQYGAPIVVKASGLALGKGVYICKTIDKAVWALKKTMIDRVHGNAGNEVVIEEFLEGPEISALAFCDGKIFSLMPISQDHKTIFENDRGPNTGGMGGIAPVPWVTDDMLRQIRKILKLAIDGLSKYGHPFKGCLYIGFKVTPQGLRVLEFNARFGDPEAQLYMRLLKTDLLDIMEACIDGNLSNVVVEWNSGFVACVVLASKGYPGKYEKGVPIYGVEKIEKALETGIIIFHAGTKYNNGQLVTSGGRVIGITTIGETLLSVCAQAYDVINLINFEGMQCRPDIGFKSLFYKKE